MANKLLEELGREARERAQAEQEGQPQEDSRYVVDAGILRIEAPFDPDDPDSETFWIQFRDKRDRFKGGERAEIYRWLDEQEGGQIYQGLAIPRRVALHVIHSWSFEIPVPRPIIDKGKVVGYENENSLDLLDTEAENFVLARAQLWFQKIALNFKVSKDKDSPTKPSGE